MDLRVFLIKGKVAVHNYILITFSVHLQVISGWLAALYLLRGEWNCSMKENGVEWLSTVTL